MAFDKEETLRFINLGGCYQFPGEVICYMLLEIHDDFASPASLRVSAANAGASYHGKDDMLRLVAQFPLDDLPQAYSLQEFVSKCAELAALLKTTP